ncbi:MAG: cob(I)yrinic acid a,c-diamide adenosyltransferase [Clostridia bacterium]|jgi:cob(I)alamin adenosyltransferase|uniref:cob(I)yrinic acid a,c-diamide adenosyltransferase n=1 Tax=Desulfitibacter alkalitolerans TaxID=264641 RepID=UPI0005529F17|nr:cob(I)yrinic acid a,c-diamide adenosyltransferase [Desulfitibacter alkalitolerans]MBS3970339.1 cob(I)yrinic acid a,c-diamide adenosyltransferase [Clostridia bacterium]
MIQIYTGNGKGKTTAAFGLAMRAVGHGFKVRIIQFMKGSTYSGELNSAYKLGIEVFQFGRTCPHASVIKTGFMKCQGCGECWIGLKEVTDLDIQKVKMAWQLARDTADEGKHDLLILDELLNSFKKDLLKVSEVADWLRQVPDDIEVVLTGRNAPPELIEMAHLVSEVKEIKHYYKIGVESRRGIEY